MTAGNVPTTNLNAFYANTTSGTPASPTAIDAAMQDIVQTVNDNYAYAAGLVASDKLSNLGILNVKDYEAKGDGVNDDSVPINSLVSYLGNSTTTLVFGNGTYNIGSSVTFPANITVVVEQGAVFYTTVTSAILTFNCPFVCGRYRVFNFAGTVQGKLKPRVIYPEWFGASTSNVDIALNTSAIKQAFVWAKNAQESFYYSAPLSGDAQVNFDAGLYQINDVINVVGNTPNIIGVVNETRIQQMTSGIGIFQCNLTNNYGSSVLGICGGKIEGIMFQNGKRQIEMISNNTGGKLNIERCVFIDSDSSDFCVYYNGVSSQLTIKECRIMFITKFLYAKCDSAILKDLEGSIYDKTTLRLPNNTALIENHTRNLSMTDCLLTIDGSTTAGTDVNYRIVDNYTSLNIENTTFDGPSGGRTIVWNYAQHTFQSWSDWNAGTYPTTVTGNTSSFASRIVIRNSSTPTNGSNGAIILLMAGVPSIIELYGLSYINGSPLIKVDSSFDILTYLTNTNLKGSISIKLKNNNFWNNGQTLYPSQLVQFIEFDNVSASNSSLTFEGSVRSFIPKIATNMMVGSQYAQTSTSSLTSIVDTGILATTYVAGLFLISVTANKNAAASSTIRDSVIGIMAISTGTAAGQQLKVEYTELFNTTPTNVNTTGLTITPVWWDGTTESATVTPSSTIQLRIKISNYDSSPGNSQRLNILCLNAQ